MSAFVKGSYSTLKEANQAATDLIAEGYNKEQIMLIANKETKKRLPNVSNIDVSTEQVEEDDSMWDKVKDFFTGEDSDYNGNEDLLSPYQNDIENGNIIVLVDESANKERDTNQSVQGESREIPAASSNQQGSNEGRTAAVDDPSNPSMPTPVGDNLGTVDTGLPPIGDATIGGTGGVPPTPDDDLDSAEKNVPIASFDKPTTEDDTPTMNTGNARVPHLTENDLGKADTKNSVQANKDHSDDTADTQKTTYTSKAKNKPVQKTSETDENTSTDKNNAADDALNEPLLKPEDTVGSDNFGESPMPSDETGNDATDVPPLTAGEGETGSIIPPSPDDTVNPPHTVDPSIPDDTNVPPMPDEKIPKDPN
ncbi:MAG: general stress protein [Pisciglobus halotolerans]|nr:general stress protein [Pisciglobus halotolerans]